MRQKLLIYLTILVLAGINSACYNEIDLLKPGEPIPVVFGMISPGDTVVQIRLTKSFDGSETPLLDARQGDSLYFQEAEVHLEIRAVDGRVVDRTPLIREEAEPRDPGIFSETPNYVYRAIPTFDIYSLEDEPISYFLSVYIPEISLSVFAEARIPETPKLRASFRDGNKINVYNYPIRPEEIRTTRSAVFYSVLEFRFNFQELIDGQWFDNHIVYTHEYAPDEALSSGFEVFTIVPDWLYTFIKYRIKTNKAVQARKFSSLQVIFSHLSPEFQYYTSGLEYSPDFYANIFSNVVNGKGLFIAKTSTEINEVYFNDMMLDSLCFGQYTKDLLFRRY